MVDFNIILMSGRGKRFKEKGYIIPKPLLDIDNNTLIEKLIINFPTCKTWLFVVNNEVLNHPRFQDFYESFEYPKDIFLIDEITNGQATSCLFSLSKLNTNNNFFVGSCDAIFNQKIEIDTSSNLDGIIFTTEPNNKQLNNSEKYGWVSGQKKIDNVFCKEKIKNADNFGIIVGSFFFKSKKIYSEIYDYLIQNNLFVNNELYIDSMFKVLNSNNYFIENYLQDVDIIGTPEEYESYINRK